MCVVLVRLKARQCRLRFTRQFPAPEIHPGDAFASAGRARSEGQALQVLAIVQRVLNGQKRAPRLTEQMHLPEVERPANRLDLGDKARYLPERKVVRLVGAPGSELIVADDAKAFGGEIEKWCQIFGIATRTTVEQQESPAPVPALSYQTRPTVDVDMSLFTRIHTLPSFLTDAGPVSSPGPVDGYPVC